MSAAQAAQEMDSRASTAPSQAGQAGHVAQTYRVPGWRGHHKLYLAALSLGGVCVWLFVWLVVFEKALPVNVVGFAAVIFEVTLKTGVFAVLFVRYVAGEGAVVAPADPGGKVGRAPSLRKWAHEAFELDAADARKRGGVDAELHVRRIRMRLACLEVWALLAVPLAGVYAVDPGRCAWFPERRIVEQESCGCCGYALGDSLPETLWADCGFDENYCSMALSPEQCTPNDDCESACATKVKKAGWYRARSPGFDRVSLTNVMCVEGNTATWQLWLAVLALYLGHWAAYKIIDAHDEAASDTIRKAAEDAPPHHYAVAATGLPENLRQPAALEAFFEGVFASPGAVVRVVPCRHLSAAAARDDVEGGAPSQPDEPPLAQLSAAHIRARHAATAADGAEHQLQRLRASGVSTRTVAAAAAEHESLKDVAARALHEITDLFGGDGGARGRVRAFCEALKEVERAEWRQALYERWEGEEKQKIQRSCATCIDGCICCCSFVEHRLADQTASPADARRRCEAARKAVADHDTDEAPGGGSAIVVFSSLESAQAAAICPLGAPDVATEVLKPTFRRDKLHRAGERGRLIVALETAGYYLTGLQGCVSKSKPVPMEVTPLPEPRDVDWGELETLDAEVGEKSDRKNAGRLIKLSVWFGYSAIVAVFAVNWEVLCEKLADEDHALLWELLAGFVPAYFQDWLFDYVAVILRATNRMFSSLWSESALQASVARDYSIFFWIVAFGAYLLSVTWAEISDEAWVCEGECDTAADPGLPADDYDINTERFDPGIAIKLMARAVPRHAWPFAALFLLQIGDMGADALRVILRVEISLPRLLLAPLLFALRRLFPTSGTSSSNGPRSRRTRAWRRRSSRTEQISAPAPGGRRSRY